MEYRLNGNMQKKIHSYFKQYALRTKIEQTHGLFRRGAYENAA